MRYSAHLRAVDDNLKLSAWVVLISVALILIGAAGLAVGFALSAHETWAWLLIDFVIFSGIANGMLAWAVAFRIGQARWTPAINRIAHSAIAFIPFLAVVLIALLAGVAGWVPWIAHPVRTKLTWLNWPAFVTRDFLSLAVLWILFFILVRWSLNADEKARRGEDITESDHHRLNSIALACAMIYSISVTIIGWDFIMSLAPRWVSTMFGPYYFTSDMYAGLMVIIIMSAWLAKPLGVEEFLQSQQFKDLGNLMLGMSLLLMGFFYAQYVTIWYENLPDESPFLIIRYLRGPWSYIGWAAFIIEYGAPFLLLQSRYLKMHRNLLWPVAALGLAGFALERYLLIGASIIQTRTLLFPAALPAIFGFAGVFTLLVSAFLKRYSPISKADEALRKVYREIEKVETF